MAQEERQTGEIVLYQPDFRQWANKVLKEYLLRGYAVNNRIERLENR